MKKNIKLTISIVCFVLFVLFLYIGVSSQSKYESNFVPKEIDCININGYTIKGATCYTEPITSTGWQIFILLGFIVLFIGCASIVDYVFKRQERD